MLSDFGKKILSFFGDPEQSSSGGSYYNEALKGLSQFYTLSAFLPYESYDETKQLFFNQDSLGFVIETLPLVGASEEMQREVSGLFQHVLPEESSLQIILWADPHIGEFCDAWQSARQGRNPVIENLAYKRSSFLKQQAFYSKQSPYNLRTFRCFLAYTQTRKSVNAVILADVNRIKNQIQTTLEMLGLPVCIWQPEHLLQTLNGLFNLDPARVNLEKVRWNKLQHLNEQITSPTTHLMVTSDGVSLNAHQVQVRAYQVRHYPDVWSLHAMGQLIGDEDRDFAQIPCPFLIHYGIHTPKQDKPKTKVLAKSTYVERQAYSPIGKYLPSIQREADELGFVRTQLGKGERIVQTQFNVILFAHENLLPTAEQILFNLYQSKEWRLEPTTFLHLPTFLSCLPMMWGEKGIKSLLNLGRLKTTLSTESANLLPLQGEWQGTKSPGMILSGRKGQIFTFCPFDNNAGNYNVSVVGRSGSGKSVFMQELMTSTLGLGGKVFVMDVGRSFEKTCSLLEGQFIEFKPKSPLSTNSLCLNPFSTISPHDEEAAQDALAMLKSVIMLMAAPTQGVDDVGAALIEQAMRETWKMYMQQCTITHIADWLLGHVHKKAQDLGTMLSPYTQHGVYGRFFNGPATVNLNNPLVVVELEELKERQDLQAVVVQMMIINITNRMFLGDRKTPFHIVFDEAWDMLRSNQSGVFIETLARRLRKYYGSLIVGTQSINDFFVNSAAQAAFDNSDWMCLLSQKKESIEQLKKSGRIALTPLMEAQLSSVKTKHGSYAEIMIYSSNGYAVGRLILDPYSGLLYSTKAEEYAAVQALRAQGLSVSDAIERLLKNQEERNQKERK
jgi:conjugal transfer ATP-binding protein TraC